ncbi:thiamine pyrophosphate-dependent enzyme [Escherichia coli]
MTAATLRELRDEHSCVTTIPVTRSTPLLLKQLSDWKPAALRRDQDVGQYETWAAQHIADTRPENFITSSGLGTMGFGLPAAVGAQVAPTNDTVVCISGDGSFMMNVQELVP